MKAKRFQIIAKKVFKVVSEDYQEYFKDKMEEHDVESPTELSDEEKGEFFTEVDEGWDEKGDA